MTKAGPTIELSPRIFQQAEREVDLLTILTTFSKTEDSIQVTESGHPILEAIHFLPNECFWITGSRPITQNTFDALRSFCIAYGIGFEIDKSCVYFKAHGRQRIPLTNFPCFGFLLTTDGIIRRTKLHGL